MLTLAASFHVDGYTVFRDIVRGDARWNTTSTFYVLADRPRLAREPDGGSAFDLLQYKRGPGDTDHAGGIVTVTVELGASNEQAAIERDITAALGARAPSAITLAPLPLA